MVRQNTLARHPPQHGTGEIIPYANVNPDQSLSGAPESQPPVREDRGAIGDLEPALGAWGEVAASKRMLFWMQKFREAGCGTAHTLKKSNQPSVMDKITKKRMWSIKSR